MRVLIVSGALLLMSCQTPPLTKSYTTPSGQAGFVVDCSGNGMTACYETAREACQGRNYDVVDKIDKSQEYAGRIVPDQRIYFTCAL